jgi:hypothetical protein
LTRSAMTATTITTNNGLAARDSSMGIAVSVMVR